MKKIEHDSTTEYLMEPDEAKSVCRLGQGEETCAFLVGSAKGFECVKYSYPANGMIHSRLDEGTMNAKGIGEWEGCPWAKGDEE